jgi:ABC-type transporter Mla maintaining outer membrane lipid asymmetry ATPase subunit MlaF
MWQVADRAMFLHGGKVVYFGLVSELEKCDHPHIREFLAMDRVEI